MIISPHYLKLPLRQQFEQLDMYHLKRNLPKKFPLMSHYLSHCMYLICLVLHYNRPNLGVCKNKNARFKRIYKQIQASLLIYKKFDKYKMELKLRVPPWV